ASNNRPRRKRQPRPKPDSFSITCLGEPPMTDRLPVHTTINGVEYNVEVEPRTLLVHLLRDELDLTGTHTGCDTGQCGACTVHLNGKAVKSCMVLAVQADGQQVTTIEGVAPEGTLHPIQ